MEISLGSRFITFSPFMSSSSSVSCKRKQQSGVSVSVSVSCRASSSATQTAHHGIQQMNDNFYNVLSLSPKSATTDDIKRAYRSMALKHHPDLCHPSMKEESTKMFVQLNEAYKTLSNPSLRQEYDCELGLEDNAVSAFSFREELELRLWREEEVAELKRRTDSRMERKKGSCSSSTRMRSRNKGRD